MDIIFHNARLIDPEAQTEAPGSLRVTDGRIAGRGAAEEAAPEGAAVIDCRGRALAPGLIDLGRQDRRAGRAAQGKLPQRRPRRRRRGRDHDHRPPRYIAPIDTPEALEFVARRAADAPVNIRHMAALTKAREGREMVEIGFLTDLGAVAFTDGVRVVRDSKLLGRCMTYARGLDALIMGHPQDPSLSAGAAATSGKFASLYGIPAVSPMAEVMGLERDLALVADDARALPRRPDHDGWRASRADPRARGGAGRDRRHLDPPPDAERVRCRRLPHLLLASPRRCGPRMTGRRWCRRWRTG